MYEDDGVRDPKEEYWDYISSVKGVEEKEDGILVFLYDLFKNIQLDDTFVFSVELYEVVM